MFKKKFYQFTLRVRKETFNFLKKSSIESGLPISSVIRGLLEKFSNGGSDSFSIQGNQNLTNSQIQGQLKSLRPIVLENNLLLRKIGRYLNTQIVLETDAQLPEHLKDREA